MSKTTQKSNNNKTRPKNKSGKPQKRKALPWIVIPIIVGAIVLVAFFLLQNQPGDSPPAAAVNETPLRAIGPQSAPVTITEFADFGCISCKAWHQFGIRERVIDTYGDQVRFVWHDFPVTTSASPKAAEAGFCAHEQGQFWAYHDIVFANAPALGVNDLKNYAEQIGLDTDEFNRCLDSGAHRASVEAELETASNLGLRSVPSFIVNDRRLIGPPSFEQLSATIDEILASQD